MLVIVLAGIQGPGIAPLIVGLSALSWPVVARLVRGETLRVAASEYVAGARAIGATDRRILFRHILPNALRPVLAIAPFTAAVTLLAESGLSFLGIGIQPPTPSWGSIIRDFTPRLDTHFALFLAPGLTLSLTIVSLSSLADWAQDVLDPTRGTL